MAKTNEERAAAKFLDVFNRLDFNPHAFAYYFTRCGYVYQEIMWKVIKHMMECWANDLDMGEDKGSKDYLRQTIFARQVLDLMNNQEMSHRRRSID